jgi:hypothetical protein
MEPAYLSHWNKWNCLPLQFSLHTQHHGLTKNSQESNCKTD